MNREKLVKQLIKAEDLKLRIYYDTKGIPTIGVGRNLRDKGISQVTARQMLDEDIEECITDLSTFPWWTNLDDVRQRVLVDMRFNLGPASFRAFIKFLAAVEEHRFEDAANAMLLSKWAEQVKTRATRLAEMMKTGQDA